jgi:hypothetical protein
MLRTLVYPELSPAGTGAGGAGGRTGRRHPGSLRTSRDYVGTKSRVKLQAKSQVKSNKSCGCLPLAQEAGWNSHG